MSKSVGPELNYIIHTWFTDCPVQTVTPSESNAELILALYCSTWNLGLDKTGQEYFLSNHKLPKDYRVKLTNEDLSAFISNIPTGKEVAVRLISVLSNRELFDQFNNSPK
jgi:hypothetical protein